MRSCSLILLILMLFASPVRAQSEHSEGRFLLGPLAWTPVVTLHDAGFDSNVFNDPTNPQGDTTATLSPRVDAGIDAPRLKISGNAVVDFVYYDRFTSERSVNRRVSARVDVPLVLIQPFVTGGYVDTRERMNPEVDVRARRHEHEGSAGVAWHVTSRGDLQVAARAADQMFESGETVRGVSIADRLNRTIEAASAGFRYDVTPLTSFVSEVTGTRERFDVAREFDANHLNANGGFAFDADAIIRGRAVIGYHRVSAVGDLALPFQGMTANVDLAYVLLGRTKFRGRLGRDAASSIEQYPYYLQTGYDVEVRHYLFGATEVIARAGREKLDYPGIESRNLVARVDVVERYGGGVAFKVSQRSSVAVDSEFLQRRSDVDSLTFDRRRLYMTLVYGF
jgi:Putative beta-barrel porin 2